AVVESGSTSPSTRQPTSVTQNADSITIVNNTFFIRSPLPVAGVNLFPPASSATVVPLGPAPQNAINVFRKVAPNPHSPNPAVTEWMTPVRHPDGVWLGLVPYVLPLARL